MLWQGWGWPHKVLMFIASSTECFLSDNSSSSVYPPKRDGAMFSIWVASKRAECFVSTECPIPHLQSGGNPKSFGFLIWQESTSNCIFAWSSRLHRFWGLFALSVPTAQPRLLCLCHVLWVTGALRGAPNRTPVRPSTTAPRLEEAQDEDVNQAYTLFQVGFKIHQLTC